ncbi:hypothetical protein [Legionella tunisiensis]|uniref:hypothetical protein n=1 Tax=Legionella tunisiensis TaxID=1034944 RepID=UPI0002F516E3|nr:hypothetical protein [Legionella tunisiensis]
MSEQLFVNKESLTRASLKIQELVQTRKVLITEFQASQKLVSELTSQIESSQRQIPGRSISATNPGFFA